MIDYRIEECVNRTLRSKTPKNGHIQCILQIKQAKKKRKERKEITLKPQKESSLDGKKIISCDYDVTKDGNILLFILLNEHT